MPITIKESDNISTIYTTERLQINLLTTKEDVEEMNIEVFFIIETQLANKKTIGFPYWNSKPLIINCKGNEELTNAMTVIQNTIGVNRYIQLATPSIIEPSESIIPH